MSISVKRIGDVLQILDCARVLPEGEVINLYTAEDVDALTRERIADLAMQMPSFIRGDEDEDSEELFQL